MSQTAKPPTVPISTLTQLFELTNVRVHQLAKDGIVVKAGRGQFELWPSVRGYIRYLRNKKTNQYDSSEEGHDGYEGHRSRLTAAKADMAEVQASIIKGTAHEAEAIKQEWADMIGAARNKLLAMPTKLAPKVHGEESLAAIRSEIETAVTEALNELSEYEPSLVTRRYVAGHQQDVDTSAEVDGEPMGGRDPEA